jgi:hypothetical protein
MDRLFYTAKAIFLGLLISQILATLQVYLSNTDLHRLLMTITEAGYLAIPNQKVMPTLRQFGPAFCGGWFFTLTLGAGLSVSAVACAWIWDRMLSRKRALLIPLVFMWLCTILAVNSQGLCPMESSYFLAIPPVVFISALKWMPKQREKKQWPNAIVHLIPLTVLAVVWTAHSDQRLFLNIRDYLLLSNPVGQNINDFYYRYTLYPAEVFKSLDQKTLKAAHVESIKDQAVAQKIKTVLINHDYLPVGTKEPVDLELTESKNNLILKHKGKTVLQSSLKEFLSRPGVVLRNFSRETDRHALFRQATILCLILGFPITLYVIAFALLRLLAGFFLSPTPSSVVAASLCLLLGLGLWVPVYIGGMRTAQEIDLSEAWDSESWQQRVAALKSAVEEELEIGNLKAYGHMLESPRIPERYWLAKALGFWMTLIPTWSVWPLMPWVNGEIGGLSKKS